MNNQQEREAFEAWLQKCHPGAVGEELIGKEENSPDTYVFFGVNKQWAAWKARAELAATPAPARPVAWTLQETLDKRETTCSARLWFTNPVNSAWAPLYAAPVAQAEPRKPLTANQFMRLYNNLPPSIQMDAQSRASFVRIGRAIEAAHGIKEQP